MNDEQFFSDRITGALNEYAKVEKAKKARAAQNEEERLNPSLRPMIYVAGPISSGDQYANAREGCMVGDIMRDHNLVPVVPQANVAWAILTSYTHTEWLDYDAQLILRCDLLYRMDGVSPGGDWEVKFARANNIPVYFAYEFDTVGDFCEHVLKLEMSVS